MKSVKDQVRNQAINQVWRQFYGPVGHKVLVPVRDQVWDKVEEQVWNQVGDQVGRKVLFKAREEP